MISSQHRDLGAAAGLSCGYSIREHLQGAKGKGHLGRNKTASPSPRSREATATGPSIPLPSLHRPTTYPAL